jgi:menaquinone-9 beta-reductase
MISPTTDRNSRIAIVGAGPAGSTLAIRLAQRGFETVLIEREKFPRHKLCGEFISPECLRHFRDVGVLDKIMSAGGDHIYETRFFEKGGRSVAVPSEWFGQGEFALSLSRAEMDHRLLERARECGAKILEGTTVAEIDLKDGSVTKLIAKRDDGTSLEIEADLFVDATGRSGSLARLTHEHRVPTKALFIGFKAHVAGADLPKGMCEIYSFPGGYAGLSNVENDRANLCFLLRSEFVRGFSNNADEIVKEVVCKNARAGRTLRDQKAAAPWLAVSVNGFGTKDLVACRNVFTVGDAAAFIDPFTGSGMLMAMESAELLANTIAANNDSTTAIAAEYVSNYQRKFRTRLRVCSALRRTAFMPGFASAIVMSLNLSKTLRRSLTRATRR